MENFEVEMMDSTAQMLAALIVAPTLIDRIKETQHSDDGFVKIKKELRVEPFDGFELKDDGSLWKDGRLCVPRDDGLKQELLKKAYNSRFSIHFGGTKIYQDLKRNYWWKGMKREIAEYIAKCLVCQQIKVEHQRPAGLLQPLEIPQWK